MAVMFVGTRFQSFKSDGTINAAGTVQFFEPGTATHKQTYSNSALTVANADPVVLNSAGCADIWYTEDADVSVYDSTAVLIDSYPNINPNDVNASYPFNFLLNGSFEQSTSITAPLYWTRSVPYSGGTSQQDADSTHGLYSWLFQSVGTGGGILTSDSFNVSPNLPLVITWEQKGTADVRNLVEILWYDDAGSLISASTALDDNTTNPTSWTLKTYLATPVATSVSGKIRFTGCHPSDSTVGTTRIDNVIVSDATVITKIANTWTVAQTFATGQPLTSPALSDPTMTGVPIAPTAALGTSTTQVATTAFVNNAVTDGGTSTSVGTKCFGFTNLPQATTAYMGALGIAHAVAHNTETNYRFGILDPVTISKLYVKTASTPPAGQTFTITLRKNGADTALTAQVTDTGTTASDITNSVDFWPGDVWSIKCVSSATTGSTNDIKVSVVVKKKNSTVGADCIFTNEGSYAYGEWGGQTTLAQSEQFLSECVLGRALPNSFNPFLFKNGVVTYLKNNGYEDTVNGYFNGTSDLFTVGAVTSFGAITTYPTQSSWGNYPGRGFVFFASQNQAQATTKYMGGWDDATASLTESDVAVPVTAGTIRNLRVTSSATVGAGQTVTFTVRKNGVDTGITCQLTNGGGRTASDSTNTITVVAGDLITISSVTSATTGTMHLTANLEHIQ